MIHYTIGDVLDRIEVPVSFILNICNNKGGWGKGFTKSLSEKWTQPEKEYKEWFAGKAISNYPLPKFELGTYQKVWVEDMTYVMNLVAQDGYSTTTKAAIDYTALNICLKQIAKEQHYYDPTIHMPPIGTGLAGGKWSVVEPIIQQTLIKAGLTVIVYCQSLQELAKLGIK